MNNTKPTYAEIKERRAKREREHQCVYGHTKFVCKPSRLCKGCADE